MDEYHFFHYLYFSFLPFFHLILYERVADSILIDRHNQYFLLGQSALEPKNNKIFGINNVEIKDNCTMELRTLFVIFLNNNSVNV